MDQKLLTVVVPSYNMEKYIKRCLGSLVVGGEDVEVIVVNDGSTDSTLEIATEFKKIYPNIIKIINKENGGHGSTINAGIKAASGEYFYTVDADDWLEVGAFERLLHNMREVKNKGREVDLFVVNYIYNQFEENKRHVIHYRNVLPQKQIFEWKDTKNFYPVQFILLHSTIHKTEILKQSGVKLPNHTFYVDNILVYNTLPLFKKLYYIDVDLYEYYIGRDDQSVNYDSMIKKIDQYVRVVKIMVEAYHLDEIQDPKLRRYMYNYLAAVLAIVNTFLTLSKLPENVEKKKDLWKFIKLFDKNMYKKLKKKPLSAGSKMMKGKAGRFVLRRGYLLGRKIFKYN